MSYKNNDFNKLVDAYTGTLNEGMFDRIGARISGAWQGAKAVTDGLAGMSDDYNTQKFTSYLTKKVSEIQKDLQAMGIDEKSPGQSQQIAAKLNDAVAQITKDIATTGKRMQQTNKTLNNAADVSAAAQTSAEQQQQQATGSQQAAAAANARSTQAAGATQTAMTANQRYGNAPAGSAPGQQQAAAAYDQGQRYNPVTGNAQQVQQKAQQNVTQGFNSGVGNSRPRINF